VPYPCSSVAFLAEMMGPAAFDQAAVDSDLLPLCDAAPRPDNTTKSSKLRAAAAIAASLLVLACGSGLASLVCSGHPSQMTLVPAKDDFSELVTLWEQSWARHPVTRAALAEAKASVPKDGEPRRSIPWPVLSGPNTFKHNRSASPPRVLVSHLSLDAIQAWQGPSGDSTGEGAIPKPEPRRLQAAGGFSLKQPDPPSNSSSKDPYGVSVCFFDVYQTVQSIAFLGVSIFYTVEAFQDTDKVYQASNLLNSLAAVSWIASFVSSIFTTCKVGMPEDAAANCWSSATWLEGNLPQLASDALAAIEDCAPTAADTAAITSTSTTTASTAATAEDPDLADASGNYGRRLRHVGDPMTVDREVSIAACFFDTQAAASFFGRFGLSVVDEIAECVTMPDNAARAECAWSTFYTIENFGWALEYLMQIAVDCPAIYTGRAQCAVDITDFILTGTSMVPAAAWTKEYCDEAAKKNETETIPAPPPLPN